MAPITISFLNDEMPDKSSPSLSTRSAKRAPNALPDDVTFFAIIPASFDIREKFRLVGLLILLSPVCLNFFAFYACMAILVGSHAVPYIIRLRYPRFMEVNILDDLKPQAGSSMALIASATALLLQVRSFARQSCHRIYISNSLRQSHNTSISLAVRLSAKLD